MDFRKIFHYISYLQYPFMLIGFYFALSPYINGLDSIKENPVKVFNGINSLLIFMGLGFIPFNIQIVG